MNIEQQAEQEDLESSLIEIQNRLERLKDEFDYWTQIYKIRLEEIQKALDILEELD